MTAFANRHGTGSFRRRQLLGATDATTVVAGIEDEMHHFELAVHHDGQVVLAVEATPVRWPWTPCFDAPEALGALVGLPLTATPADIARAVDASEQCTHQFDLATLAVAHAGRHAAGGAARRDYRTEVPDWHEAPFVARLWRDDVLLLEWTCDISTVHGPAPFTGAPLRSGFFAWCAANLDADTAEAAQVLRRSAWISPARRLDLESFADASASGLNVGICYASQPHRMPVALRNRGTLRDYGPSPEPLLADLDERLRGL